MHDRLPTDVARLLSELMATGRYATEDDLLRAALEALGDEEGELEAIQAALVELDRGVPAIPAIEVFAKLRLKHRLPTD